MGLWISLVDLCGHRDVSGQWCVGWPWLFPDDDIGLPVAGCLNVTRSSRDWPTAQSDRGTTNCTEC